MCVSLVQVMSKVYWIQLAILSGFISNVGGFKSTCSLHKLPYDVRTSQNGPVLKVYCSTGMRPLEVDVNGVIIPSRVRFARYICSNGTYKRVDSGGTNPARYFCADEEASKCPLLEVTTNNISLSHHHVVARITCKRTKNFTILYCTRGVWHNLDAVNLPAEIRLILRNQTEYLYGKEQSTKEGSSGPLSTNDPTTIDSSQVKEITASRTKEMNTASSSNNSWTTRTDGNSCTETQTIFMRFYQSYIRNLTDNTPEKDRKFTATSPEAQHVDTPSFRFKIMRTLGHFIPFICLPMALLFVTTFVFIYIYKKYVKSLSIARLQLIRDLHNKLVHQRV